MKDVKMRYLNAIVGICVYTTIFEAFVLSVVTVLWHENYHWDFIQMILILGALVGMSCMFPVSYVSIRIWCNNGSISKCNRITSLAFFCIYTGCQLVLTINVLELMPNKSSKLAFFMLIGFILTSSLYFPIKEFCEEKEDSKK